MAVYSKTKTLSNDKFYEVRIRNFGLEEMEQIEACIRTDDQKNLVNIIAGVIDKNNFPVKEDLNTGEKKADIGELLSGDFRNLVLWSRIRTLDSTIMKLQFKCSNQKCNHTNLNYEFDVNEFDMVDLDEELELENEVELSDGTKVTILLEKMKHADEIEKLKKKIPSANEQLLRYTVLTRFHNGLTNSIDRYNFLKDPDNVKVAKEIKDFITKKCFFGVIPITFITCPVCGRVSQIRLNFRADIFDTPN